jgi:hypothetical protein
MSQTLLDKINTAGQLNHYINNFTTAAYPDSKLKPISGGGLLVRPDTMLVFINPTKRNIASNPEWTGSRVPWVGITPIWNVLTKVGLIEKDLNIEIQEKKKLWTPYFTDHVYSKLAEYGLYLTNIVKWAGEDATLPEMAKIKRYLPILHKEIEIIKPRKIICFGTIPYQAITKDKIKLKTVYDSYKLSTKAFYKSVYVNKFETKVFPCYFPVGLGQFNQPKAIEILSAINKL